MLGQPDLTSEGPQAGGRGPERGLHLPTRGRHGRRTPRRRGRLEPPAGRLGRLPGGRPTRRPPPSLGQDGRWPRCSPTGAASPTWRRSTGRSGSGSSPAPSGSPTPATGGSWAGRDGGARPGPPRRRPARPGPAGGPRGQPRRWVGPALVPLAARRRRRRRTLCVADAGDHRVLGWTPPPPSDRRGADRRTWCSGRRTSPWRTSSRTGRRDRPGCGSRTRVAYATDRGWSWPTRPTTGSCSGTGAAVRDGCACRRGARAAGLRRQRREPLGRGRRRQPVLALRAVGWPATCSPSPTPATTGWCCGGWPDASEARAPSARASAVRVTGVVQGVGFRPFVHALATSAGADRPRGQRRRGGLRRGRGPGRGRRGLPPPAAGRGTARSPSSSRCRDPRAAAGGGVRRSASSPAGDAGGRPCTLIPPDTAVCADCLAEVARPADRRYRYPFTACTYCGPRYTIVTGPALRPAEHHDGRLPAVPGVPAGVRRPGRPAVPRPAHRLPGVRATAVLPTAAAPGSASGSHGDAALADALRAAGSPAASSRSRASGGYHLACDAPQLRWPSRGCASASAAPTSRSPSWCATWPRHVAWSHLDASAARLLASPQAPIVLAPARTGDPRCRRGLRQRGRPRQRVPGAAAAVLPAAPPAPGRPPGPAGPEPPWTLLVMTSGQPGRRADLHRRRRGDERLAAIADAFLHHDRPIHVACDDSVVRVVDGDVQPVRRSRGYAPLPRARPPLEAPPTLAVGGELKTTALPSPQGDRAWLSQHVGDTAEPGDARPAGADRGHPVGPDPGPPRGAWSPTSTRTTCPAGGPRARADATGADLVLVQHHHAHVASLLAEHGVAPGEPVLGRRLRRHRLRHRRDHLGRRAAAGHVRRRGAGRPPRPGPAARRGRRGPAAGPGRPGPPAAPPGLAWDADAAVGRRGRRRGAPGRRAACSQTGAGCTPTTSAWAGSSTRSPALLGVRQDVTYEGQAAIELEALAATAAPAPGRRGRLAAGR